MSRPTIIQCIKGLEELGLVEKNGFFESTGGRKAEAITFIASAKIAIGVELVKDSYELVAINLYVKILKPRRIVLTFHNNNTYYQKACI